MGALTACDCERYSKAMNKDSVVLIGMAGAGKSTVGRLLAAKLGFKFIDLDQYIQEREGRPVQGIIDGRGEKEFLEIEEKWMRQLKLKRTVVAPGGSIVYRANLMAYLKERVWLVFLDAPFDEIWKRLANAPTRGIIGLSGKSLEQIFDERYPLYKKYADIMVESGGRTPKQVAEEIASRLSAVHD